jgi:hypothetical protein
MCIANYWAISAVLKHFDENWIGGYKKGVCPFSHQRMRTTLVIITTAEAANQVSYAAETRFACDRDRFACKSFERNWEQRWSARNCRPCCGVALLLLRSADKEDAMCYERDYKIFEDQKKAEDTRVVQERRAGLIDRLLNDANKHGEKTKAEETPVKEAAPAK